MEQVIKIIWIGIETVMGEGLDTNIETRRIGMALGKEILIDQEIV